MMTIRTVAVLIAMLAGAAQAVEPEHAPFDADGWTFSADVAETLEFRGKSALRLHNGTATLDGVAIENGVVDFDVAFSEERGFVGVMWRMVDGRNYEYFYMRPHQSGNPDANQYTPVYNGVPGWQLYHGDGYGAPVAYPLDEWLHVRVVFWDDQAVVFIGDMDTPAVRVPALKRTPVSGAIGIRAQNAPAFVSGLSYRSLDARPFDVLPADAESAPAGSIIEWEVSSPFDGTRLESVNMLEPDHRVGLTWQTLESEPSGIANLATLHGVARGRDTVFARTAIHASRAELRELRFGYSDRVKVYVNGRALYAGDNTYRSRDYRYLGTIGHFDTVFLPLEAGDNEVLFAVTEAFGGWGLTARTID